MSGAPKYQLRWTFFTWTYIYHRMLYFSGAWFGYYVKDGIQSWVDGTPPNNFTKTYFTYYGLKPSNNAGFYVDKYLNQGSFSARGRTHDPYQDQTMIEIDAFEVQRLLPKCRVFFTYEFCLYTVITYVI